MTRKKKPVEAIADAINAGEVKVEIPGHDLFPITPKERVEMQAELLEKELQFDGMAEQIAGLAEDASSIRLEQKKIRTRIMILVRTLEQKK